MMRARLGSPTGHSGITIPVGEKPDACIEPSRMFADILSLLPGCRRGPRQCKGAKSRYDGQTMEKVRLDGCFDCHSRTLRAIDRCRRRRKGRSWLQTIRPEECRLRWPSVIFLTRLIPKTLALSSNRQYWQAKPTRPAVARPLDSLEHSLRF